MTGGGGGLHLVALIIQRDIYVGSAHSLKTNGPETSHGRTNRRFRCARKKTIASNVRRASTVLRDMNKPTLAVLGKESFRHAIFLGFIFTKSVTKTCSSFQLSVFHERG